MPAATHTPLGQRLGVPWREGMALAGVLIASVMPSLAGMAVTTVVFVVLLVAGMLIAWCLFIVSLMAWG